MLEGVKLEDLGMADVTIGDVTRTLDVVRTFNKLVALQTEHKDSVDAYNAAVAAHITELGFGTCSDFLAIAFARSIGVRKQELESQLGNWGLGETRRVSPASTASTPSDSPSPKS